MYWNLTQRFYLQPFKDVTVHSSTQQFPTISFGAMVYSTLFEHMESFCVDQSRGMEGIDPKTNQVYPTWVQDMAKAGIKKLQQYYPSSHGLAHVAGTGNSEHSYLNRVPIPLFNSVIFLVMDPRLKFQWYKASNFRLDKLPTYEK